MFQGIILLIYLVLVLSRMLPETFVGPKTISRPESFVTEVAGDDDSFEVVCFDVIFYVIALAFLSTHFAEISISSPLRNFVLAFIH